MAFLPDVPFLTPCTESDLATALAASRNILIVVPSHVFGDVLQQIKPLMRPDARIVWATKGLEAETGRLLQDVAREVLGTGSRWRLSPAQRLPKSWPQACQRQSRWPPRILFCGRSSAPAALRQEFPRLQQPRFYRRAAGRCGEERHRHWRRDVRRHWLWCQCTYCADYPWVNRDVPSRGGTGCRSGHLMGMAGLGDLVLTCTDNQSRNRRFGMMLGQGMDVKARRRRSGS